MTGEKELTIKATEKDIEGYFVRKVRQAGGRAYKFGQNGLPDRICVFPGGLVYFVELKRPGERPRPLQYNRQKELTALGASVVPYIDTKTGVDTFVDSVLKGRMRSYMERYRDCSKG